jgi:shikimate kinase
MGVTEKVWDALTTVIKMNDKVVALAGTVKEQQAKIESLTERVIRLEAQLETMFKVASIKHEVRHLPKRD